LITATILGSAGHPQVDKLLSGIIGLFELIFPQRIQAYYLVGSYADGSATPLSDIDVRVIFKGDFADPQEDERFRQARQHCRMISPIVLSTARR
jgi:hypothetical protein